MEVGLKIDNADLALSEVALHAVRKGLLLVLWEMDAVDTSGCTYFGHSKECWHFGPAQW